MLTALLAGYLTLPNSKFYYKFTNQNTIFDISGTGDRRMDSSIGKGQLLSYNIGHKLTGQTTSFTTVSEQGSTGVDPRASLRIQAIVYGSSSNSFSATTNFGYVMNSLTTSSADARIDGSPGPYDLSLNGAAAHAYDPNLYLFPFMIARVVGVTGNEFHREMYPITRTRFLSLGIKSIASVPGTNYYRAIYRADSTFYYWGNGNADSISCYAGYTHDNMPAGQSSFSESKLLLQITLKQY